ncbi:MAG: hypothetical protein KFH87_00645 [Bacteroidetes bacterium]|nr:hypothetical protein [Bacteroidota bacterium]
MKSRQPQHTPWMLLAAALCLPLAAQFLTLLSPAGRLWGVNALQYLPDWFPLVYVIVPFVLYAAFRGLEQPRLRLTLLILLSAAALLPLLIWPVQTYFYGDGGLLIPQIHRFSAGLEYDQDLLLNMKSSPLAGALLLLAMHTAPAAGELFSFLMPEDALYPFRWVSFLCLGIVVGYIGLVFRGNRRLTLFLAVAGTAGALLYAGYVEFYTPVFAALTIYLLAAERALTGKGSIWPVLAAYLVTVAAHFMSIALLPSLLLLLACRSEAIRNRLRMLRHPDLRHGLLLGIVVIAGWSIVYVLAGFHDSPSRIVMPLVPQSTEAGTQAYTLFGAPHLLDMLNLFALLAPAAAITLIGVWILHLRRKAFGDHIDAFHAANVLLFGGFSFFANATLGLARDWDLLAPLGIILLLAALSFLHRHYGERSALILALISLTLTLPWLHLHRDEDATADRFSDIMELDTERIYGDYALSGFDALRKYHHRRGDVTAEIGLTRRMIVILDYPQHYREFIGMAQLRQRSDPEFTREHHGWVLERLTGHARRLRAQDVEGDYSLSLPVIDSLAQAIGFLAVGNETLDDVRPGLATLAELTREGRPFPAIDGLLEYHRGAWAVSADYFQRAVEEGFHTAEVYLFFGNALALSGRYSESLSRFEQGVRRFPDSGMLRFTLGKYYVRAGIQQERAVELLRWCIEHNDPPQHSDDARMLLNTLIQR